MTSLIKVWELPGGIHPPENKRQSMALPLGHIPLPPRLVLPLNQHIGTPAKATVLLGERVLKGQIIGAADGTFSANVHAPTSGTVIAIEEAAYPHPSGFRSEAIIIEPDGQDEWIELEPCANYLAQDRLQLLNKIRAGGVAGLGGAGFPTAVKLAPKSTQVIDTLIINGAECEPYITADDMLMQVKARELVEGTLLLSHILHHPKSLLIGIEDNKPEAIKAVQAAVAEILPERAEAAHIKVVSFPTKYPSGGAKQLIQILTGREVPSGHHSADAGIICVNVGTTVAAWRAVRYGEPLISRIATVVGQSLATQRNIEVLLGTPIDFVLQAHGYQPQNPARVIMGGPMMGFTLPDLSAPVIKTTNCLLAPTAKELPLPAPAQACIRCGICAEACPASLLPQQLFWYAQAEDYDRLEAHNLFDCIECGACSYVCPSSIPLVQYYRAAKGAIRLHEIEKEKSDRSRQRFEFRQARIAKEEAEKEAKRHARQQAAEEAKKKLAEKVIAAGHTGAPVKPASDVIGAAMARAQGVQQSPEEQKAKLERILAAAKNGLEFAQKPLVANEPGGVVSEEQLEKQKARIKQAELKLAEAEKKLAEFTAGAATPAIAATATSATATAAAATTAAPAADDPVAAAIARAQAKMTMSPAEKAKANYESLQSRLSKAQEKAAAAKAEGASTADALQQGADKLQQKLAEAEAELQALGLAIPAATAPAADAAPASAEQSAAQAAIDKAKAKAAALAGMSEEQKRAEQLQSLQSRLQKARERLAKAEADNDANIDAFRAGVTKLEDKLREFETV